MREVAEQNRHKLLHGVAAGTIATILMTALLVAAPAFAGQRLPDVAARVLAALQARPLLVMAAFLVHFAYGALAGALFAAGARRINVAAGLFFGLALWGVAVTIYAPLMGLGFIASHQPALAALVLPAHLLYGGALGALAPRGEIVQPIEDSLPAFPLTLADA
ncbi:MAG: hypothetical protein JWN44_7028 [Myxococcales bacterium]|nr:hypothetical protein [Myxococcales bacterium]